MPVQTIKDAGQVMEVINGSSKPVVIHYWDPSKGPESPLTPLFWEADATRGGDIDFVIVDSGFIHPQHIPEEMPLTVLYHYGREIETAPFDPNAIHQLIDRA